MAGVSGIGANFLDGTMRWGGGGEMVADRILLFFIQISKGKLLLFIHIFKEKLSLFMHSLKEKLLFIVHSNVKEKILILVAA